MRLRRLHLPGLTRYDNAASLQSQLVRAFLDHKQGAPASGAPPPEPAVLTAEFHPVYTCGRREVATVSPAQQAFLRADGKADFHAALRGGQTTFHGPGQLVAYPILDLKRHGLGPRSYVCLLERAVIDTCARFGVRAFRTDNPGVWTTADDKICALGVHLRRNVTSHGVGFNVTSEPLPWFERIVACGLEGKHATSLEKEGVRGAGVADVAAVFVDELRRALAIEQTDLLTPAELD